MALVLALSSHVARGYVGNVAATVVLQALGHEVWQIPTITLSNHKGYRHCAGAPPPSGTIRAMVDALNDNGWLGEVDAVLSGYIASPDQAGEILYAVDAVKHANPDAFYWCDPILGDYPGGLYVPEAVAKAIADTLVPQADGISPNAFELAWLSGTNVVDPVSGTSAARNLPDKITMTTSVPSGAGELSNLLVSEGCALKVSHPIFDQVPHGTGDVFTALAIGHLMSAGKWKTCDDSHTQAAFEKASNCIFSLARETMGREELDYTAIVTAIRSTNATLASTPI